MEPVHFQDLLRQAELERARSMDEVERRYRERVASIRNVWELNNAAEPLPSDQELIQEALRHGELMRRVRSVVATLAGQFTVRDVLRVLRGNHPSEKYKETSVSSALQRLTGTSLEVVQPGAGKRASVYRRMTEGEPKGAQSAVTLVG